MPEVGSQAQTAGAITAGLTTGGNQDFLTTKVGAVAEFQLELCPLRVELQVRDSATSPHINPIFPASGAKRIHN